MAESRAKPTIVRPVPYWQQIADYLRGEILSGRYPAGQPLPSEEVLAGEFGVSRPTIRQGIATLVSEGLLSVRRPYGTIVQDPHARPAHLDQRGLHAATGDGYTEPDSPDWSDAGEPMYLRVDATAAHADLLQVPPGQPMLAREVMQEAGGLRRYQGLYVPFSVAADLHTPWADQPHLPAPRQLYAWFAEAGHRPQFTEYVRARMPVGDESSTLNIRPGVPLLVVLRIAHADRPLALEETRTPADTIELAYPLPVTTTPARRARPAGRR